MVRVAVVTGSNKGIGYAIVRALCKQFDGAVYLTARDKGRGEEAIQKLRAEGLEPRFHQLDIVDKGSIDTLAKYLRETYGGLDILVNNAGIAFKVSSTVSVAEQAQVTVATNFWGVVSVCKSFFPLLKPGARVVNMSSFNSGQAYGNCSDVIKQSLDSCTTVEQVGSYMDKFVESARNGNLEGWPPSCYGCAHIGVSLVTPILHKQVDQSNSDIVVNMCCPGRVASDMSNHKGNKTIDQGADTPVYLALLPPNTDIRGLFLTDRKVVPWREAKRP